MGAPTSEVGYTSATARRGDHESSYEHVVALEKKRKNVRIVRLCTIKVASSPGDKPGKLRTRYMQYTRTYTSLICDMCHNSKFVIFQEKRLKVLKCYNFLCVQLRHNCCPAASFANCVMTLYLLKVHLQTFLSITITKKCQILSCDTLVANERYNHIRQK